MVVIPKIIYFVLLVFTGAYNNINKNVVAPRNSGDYFNGNYYDAYWKVNMTFTDEDMDSVAKHNIIKYYGDTTDVNIF